MIDSNELGDAFVDAVEVLSNEDKQDFRKCMRAGFNGVWAKMKAEMDITVNGVTAGYDQTTDVEIQ